MLFGYVCIENSACRANTLHTEIQKNFNTLQLVGRIFFKSILKHLFCIKYNEINMSHPYVQKYICYKKWH